MNRDDIIRLAREAGAIPSGDPQEWDVWLFQAPAMERFAALVAAEEREALKEERRSYMGEVYSLREAEESLREEVERLRAALKAETARCAKVCEDAARRCRDAGWDDHAAVLRDAARQMQAGAEK